MKAMKEADVTNIFRGYKKQLIKQMGVNTTTNVDLDRIAYKLLGSRFKGTYSQNNIPLNKSGMYIMNTDMSTGPGIHWVSVVVSPKKVYVYDSFARKTKKLLPVFYRNAKLYEKTVINSDTKDTEQKPSELTCGPVSLAWLLSVKELGIKNSLKI